MLRKTFAFLLYAGFLLASSKPSTIVTTQRPVSSTPNDNAIADLQIRELFDLVADIFLDYDVAHQNPSDENLDSLLEQLQLSQNHVQRIFDEVETKFESVGWNQLSQRFEWIKVKAQTLAVFEVIRAAHKDVNGYRNNDFSSFTERSYRGVYKDIPKEIEKIVYPYDLFNNTKWKQYVTSLQNKLTLSETKKQALVAEVKAKINELQKGVQACEHLRQVVERDAKEKHQFLNVQQQHELNFIVDYPKQSIATLEKLITWL